MLLGACDAKLLLLPTGLYSLMTSNLSSATAEDEITESQSPAHQLAINMKSSKKRRRILSANNNAGPLSRMEANTSRASLPHDGHTHAQERDR